MNFKNIKLIVTDMDGTLLNEKQELSEYSIEVIKQVQKLGYKFCLASGRNPIGLERYGKFLDLDLYDGYYICANGSSTIELKTNKREIIKQIEVEKIHELFEFAKEYEVEFISVLDDTLYDYIPDSLMEIKKEYRKKHNISDDIGYSGNMNALMGNQKNYPNLHFTKSISEYVVPANKIVMTHTPEYLVDFVIKLKEKYNEQYNITMSSDRWIELTPIGVDKGTAIKSLINKLNIKEDEVLIFGDAGNDYSMFEAFKYTVAMKNGMNIVKDIAFMISEYDNNNDGVCRTLEKYLLGKEN